MGLVKFNNQTLSIPEVPDGLVLMPENEVATLRSQQNEFLSLKSRIPVGVDQTQLGLLIEKGQRFDSETAERTKASAKIAELEKNIAQFSSLPKDFSADKWNAYVKQEQEGIRSKKLSELTAKVKAEVKEKFKVDIEVDPRFIDSQKVQAFDPDAQNAYQEWYAIMDEAHTAQTDFIQKTAAGASPANEPVGGARAAGTDLNIGDRHTKGDQVSGDGVRMRQL